MSVLVQSIVFGVLLIAVVALYHECCQGGCCVQVTGFSNTEEAAVGKVEVVPFLLEDKLKELGGEYSKADEDWAVYSVSDQRLITGQNPASSKQVAAHIIEALK
ncbi:MAG: hypothetical protein HC767_13725 [Akkermansiaceae bacterium]|nr:hypothetical protein [Akkermansiaceae bacterium]